MAVVGVLVVRDDDGNGAGRTARPGERLEAIDVDQATFEERWDAAIEALGGGDALGELDWVADEALGLERAEQTLDDWGLLELYRHPDERLAAVDLVGAFVTDDDRSRFRADAVAAVAAALDEDATAAAARVDGDLGFASATPEPSSSLEVDGLTIVVERSETSAELRISRT